MSHVCFTRILLDLLESQMPSILGKFPYSESAEGEDFLFVSEIVQMS